MIGLLNAYLFDAQAEYQLKYGAMFEAAIRSGLKTDQVKSYKVALGELPKSPTECDLWVISGSAKSSYDREAWIQELKDFVVKCDKSKAQMIGLCFGHQLIADALGGKVEKSDKGWGIGVRSVEVLKDKTWMMPKSKVLNLIFSHQDQVIELPEEAEWIATSDFCKYEAFMVDEHILCLQGHPEFTIEFAKDRYLDREDLIGASKVEKALESFNTAISYDLIWSWLREFKR
ncbi:MAG: hypothetical protein KDD50_00450 [Bdellovibrionales bacterium]|nr:hypothetical protein [Bdellovibrionales bacterium]